MRLQCSSPAQHAVTVPMHDAVKAGTLHWIFKEVAKVQGMAVEKLLGKLIG